MDMDGVITRLGGLKARCVSTELPEDAGACTEAVSILYALLDGGIHTLEEAKNLVCDYNALAKQYRALRRKHETAGQAIHKDGVWHCPDCGSRVRTNYSFCHWCGKKLDWARERDGDNMKPIYKPKGAAAEYGDYAINIYTGCPHRCYYCFAPQVLRRDREAFHSRVEPRKNIVRELQRQLERERITRQLIHLCFACDPYPTISENESGTTREVIQVLKEYGNNVQILTKGTGRRDFDLLDGGDWYGVTISCDGRMSEEAEPCAASTGRRLADLKAAKENGINTWVSFEPVLDPAAVLDCIRGCAHFIDKVKIGKLNYWPSDIDWAQFGRDAENLCRETDLDYYIKDSLRAEMDRL